MLDALLPRRCSLCGATGTGLCAACARLLPGAPELPCAPEGLRSCRSLLRYDGPTRTLVAALKYRGHRDAVELLGTAMADLADGVPAMVTWAPTTPARRRSRGYDQAELLARVVARRLGVPCAATLRRRPGRPQTLLGRRDRLEEVGFDAVAPCPPTVLLIDDVRTTGATLSAAGRELLAAGAEEVRGLTLAVNT
jgi:predicted amidophosphoribosyltransferase